MQGVSTTIAFALISISLGVYAFAARAGRNNRYAHPDDYFLAKSRMSGNDLGDAQIGYALQMATVFPFFSFAITGDWLYPLVNTVMWGVGILLFYHWIPRYRPLLGKSLTIHAFVGDVNNSPKLRILASALSIIAFLGILVFEIVFGSKVFYVIFGGNQIIYYAVIAFFSTYLMSYIWSGGQTGVIRTEKWQLVLAYAGLHLVIAYLLSQPLGLPISWLVFAKAIAVLVLLLSAWMAITRGKSFVRAFRAKNWVTAGLYAIMLGSLFTMIFAIFRAAQLWSAPSDPRLLQFATPIDSVLTWATIATYMFLPLVWQFVDLSNWQRMCSVGAADSDQYRKAVQQGIYEYLVESPLSWLLPIFLGTLAVGAVAGLPPPEAVDPLVYFLTALFQGSLWAQLCAIVLSVGIVGIFMSTADAVWTAIGYAYAYDLHRESREIIDRNDLMTEERAMRVVNIGRRFMVISTVFVVAMFVLLDAIFKQGMTLIGLLFACYTPVLAFSSAAMIPVRWGIRPQVGFIYVAIYTGAALGIGLGVYSTFGDPNLQNFAVPATLLSSWTIYGIGLLFRRIPVQGIAEQ